MAVGAPLTLPVPDVNDVFLDFTHLRLYRASSFGGTYTFLANIPLVADVSVYTYQDTAALPTDWYRTSYYNTTGPVESQKSQPFPATEQPVVTLATLAQLVANELGLYGRPRAAQVFPGPSGTAVTGSTSTLLLSPLFAQTLMQKETWLGWHVKTSNGGAGQVADFSVSGGFGRFTVEPALSPAPVADTTTFELYGVLPAAAWREMVNGAMEDIWVPDWVAVGGIEGQAEYALPYFVEQTHQVIDFYHRSGDVLLAHTYVEHDFDTIELPGGGVALRFYSGLTANDVYSVKVYRKLSKLAADTDYLTLPQSHQRLIIVTACRDVCLRLGRGVGGASRDRKAWRDMADDFEQQRISLAEDLAVWTEQTGARGEDFIAMGGGDRW